MPWSKGETARIFFAMRAPWNRVRGDRKVRRHVQGVPLVLPRSHMLPVYARVKPGYGQNLVHLAARLAAASPADQLPLCVMDIGANIGDSALQIIAGTDANVLCVEADPYWARYLHENVDDVASIVVEEVMLLPEDSALQSARAVRDYGTTRFVESAPEAGALPMATAAELRHRNPRFEQLRLIKSDTDGYDTVLVPAAAKAWADAGPVLFFEFDPELTRKAGYDPNEIWSDLAALGYSKLAVWDNAGDPLGQLDINDATTWAGELEPKPVERGYHFWDVAACRADDDAAIGVFNDLVPRRFEQPVSTR